MGGTDPAIGVQHARCHACNWNSTAAFNIVFGAPAFDFLIRFFRDSRPKMFRITEM